MNTMDDLLPRYTNQKSKPPKIGDPTIIIWEDAQAQAIDWEPHDTQYQTTTTISIGILWEHTDTHHTLITTLNHNHITMGITIPNGCITKTLTP